MFRHSTKYTAAPAMLALALVLLATPAQAASFDCVQASADIERTICGDADLSKLDELLGDRYGRALNQAEDPKAVKAAQRAWLRDVRNACASVACLKAVYNDRIVELRKLGRITDEKARAICDEVVGALNDGSLEERFAEFRRASEEENKAWLQSDPKNRSRGFGWLEGVLEVDYDSDGEPDRLGRVSMGGTCSWSRIFDLADGYPLEIDGPEQMGIGDRFLLVQGRGVVARVAYTRNILYVLGLQTPTHGEAQPALCDIRRTSDIRAEILEENDPALCRAVAAGRVEILPWSPADGLELSDDEMNLDDIAGTAVLDLDLDGSKDTIALLDWSRGSGCGLDWRTMAQLDPATRSRPDNPLNRFLRANTDGVRIYPDDKDRWYSPVIFRFDGKPYFYSGAGKPVVSSIWHGEPRKWCKFRLLPQHVASPPNE